VDLRQLEYFLAISETGAFSRAAMRLAIGQPVLSRQMKALEVELGTELYHRTGRGVVLTEAGKLLEEHARAVIERTTRARCELRALGEAPTGRVVIGMPPSVGAVLTAPLVRQFRGDYPQVSLGVMEGFSAHVLEWLTDARIDVAVLYNAPSVSVLAAEALLTDELFLLGPRDDPGQAGDGSVPASAFAQLPLILPSRPHGLRLLVDDYLGKARVKPNLQLEIDAMPSTLNLVEAGMGYTVLSYSCVHHLIEAGRIRHWHIADPMTRTLVLATSTQRPLTKVARALQRMVRKQIHDLLAQGRWKPQA
jgi:LysR family nitrogen assimilation transcriptional regulator